MQYKLQFFTRRKEFFSYFTKQSKLETDSYIPTVSFRSVINEWMLRRSSANSWKKWRSVKLSFWASNTRSAGTNCLYYSTFPSPALSPTFVGNFKTKSMVLNDSFKISLLLISNTDISLNLCRDTQTLVKNRVKQRLTLKRESRLVHKLFFSVSPSRSLNTRLTSEIIHGLLSFSEIFTMNLSYRCHSSSYNLQHLQTWNTQCPWTQQHTPSFELTLTDITKENAVAPW